MGQDFNGRLCQLVGDLMGRGLTLPQATREFERQFILTALKAHDGNLSRSAKAIGVHRNTLHNKVARLGIEPRPQGGPDAGDGR